MNEDVKNKLKQILESITGEKFDTLDLEKDIQSQLKLDSIKIVELFSTLEETFKIELPLSMMNVKSVNEFIQRFEQELNA